MASNKKQFYYDEKFLLKAILLYVLRLFRQYFWYCMHTLYCTLLLHAVRRCIIQASTEKKMLPWSSMYYFPKVVCAFPEWYVLPCMEQYVLLGIVPAFPDLYLLLRSSACFTGVECAFPEQYVLPCGVESASLEQYVIP